MDSRPPLLLVLAILGGIPGCDRSGPLASGARSADEPVGSGELQAGGRLGTTITSAGDFDADGFHDLIVSDELRSSGGASRGEPPRYLSSRDGAIPAVHRPQIDFDGDGVVDYLAATLDEHAGIYSGKTHEPLRVFPEQRPFGYLEGFGSSLSWAGDVNGDGVLDVAVGCSELGIDRGDEYYVALFSGKDASMLRVLDSGRMHTVVGEGADLDRDGIPDLPVGLPEAEMVVVLSGSALRDPNTSREVSSGDWPVLWRLRRSRFAPGTPFGELPSPPTPR